MKRTDENPYWEKWKPGRPTKAAIEKRRKAERWREEYRRLYPEQMPFISFLLDSQTPTGQYNYQSRCEH